MENNEFLKLASERYSCRSFSEKNVEDEKTEAILTARRLAPTACNKQPQKIYVLRSSSALEKLQKCKPQHYGETLAFIVCFDEDLCWKREYDGKLSGETDAAITATQMMLEAQSLGIGSTWVMYFDPNVLREEFSLPSNIIPAAILVMGYPSDSAEPSVRHGSRKEISEMAEYL